jgi:hypothetical protein
MRSVTRVILALIASNNDNNIGPICLHVHACNMLFQVAQRTPNPISAYLSIVGYRQWLMTYFGSPFTFDVHKYGAPGSRPRAPLRSTLSSFITMVAEALYRQERIESSSSVASAQ